MDNKLLDEFSITELEDRVEFGFCCGGGGDDGGGSGGGGGGGGGGGCPDCVEH